MRRDVQEAIAASTCREEVFTAAVQTVCHAWDVRPSDARPWLAGVRRDDSCTIAVDVRRETVLIHCDVFGTTLSTMDGERMEEEALRDRAAARRRRA